MFPSGVFLSLSGPPRRDYGHVKDWEKSGIIKTNKRVETAPLNPKPQKCLESEASVRAWVDAAEGSEQKAIFSPEH